MKTYTPEEWKKGEPEKSGWTPITPILYTRFVMLENIVIRADLVGSLVNFAVLVNGIRRIETTDWDRIIEFFETMAAELV